MRWVSTRVLPEPAPATTSSGPLAVGDGLALDRVQPVEAARRHGTLRRGHRGHTLPARLLTPPGSASGGEEALPEEVEHLVEGLAGGVAGLVDQVAR